MSSFYFRNRKEKIKEQLKEKSLILILNPINCFYLTNFTSSSAMIILTNKKDYYVTDNRYYEAAKNNIKEFEVISFKKEKLFFLKKIIKNINTIFIEEDFINYKNYKNILTIKNCEIRDISDKLKEIRAIKDELEIENIKKACNISKKVINEIIKKKIYEKKSEVELKNFINIIGLKKYSSSLAFEPIVAYDANSSIPHYYSTYLSNKKLPEYNILIDFGLCYNNYKSDLTRTLLLNKIKNKIAKKLEDSYKIIEETIARVKEKLRAGISVKSIDNLVRNFFKENKVDENFLHSTGHGVGLEIHELPYISAKQNYVLKENNVITIEPGLYFEGIGGIRIENTILIKKNGYEILTE